MKRGRKTSRERDGFPHTKTKYRHGDRDHTPKTMRAWRPLLWLEVCHSRSLLFPLSYLSCLPPLKSIKCIGCQEYFFCFRFALPSPIAAFFTIAVSELQLQNNIYIYIHAVLQYHQYGHLFVPTSARSAINLILSAGLILTFAKLRLSIDALLLAPEHKL